MYDEEYAGLPARYLVASSPLDIASTSEIAAAISEAGVRSDICYGDNTKYLVQLAAIW